MLRKALVWLDDQLSQEIRCCEGETVIEPSEQHLYEDSNFNVIYNTLKNLVAIINDGSFEESYGQALDVLNACMTDEKTLKEFFVNPDNWLLALTGNDPLYGFGSVVNELLRDHATTTYVKYSAYKHVENVRRNFIEIDGREGCPLHAAARFNLVRISKYLLIICATRTTAFQIPIGMIAASYNNLETARLDDFDENKRTCGPNECVEAAAYAMKYRNKNLYTYFQKRYSRFSLGSYWIGHITTSTRYNECVFAHAVEEPENLAWALNHKPPLVSLRSLIKCIQKRSDVRIFFPAIRRKLISSETLVNHLIPSPLLFIKDEDSPSAICELIDYTNEVPHMGTFIRERLSGLPWKHEESFENIAIGLHFQSNAITKLRSLYTLFEQQLHAGGRPGGENILGRIVNTVISKPDETWSVWNVLTPDVLKEDTIAWGRRLFYWFKLTNADPAQIMSAVELSKQSTSSVAPADIVSQYCVILEYAFGKVISNGDSCIALISQVWEWPGEPENTPFELVQFARSACNICGEKFMYDAPLWQSYHVFGLKPYTNECKEQRILFWMSSFNNTHMKSLERARFIQELVQTGYFLNRDFDVFVKNPAYFIDEQTLWYLNNTLKGI